MSKSKTPKTDAAFRDAYYKVDDDMAGSSSEYDIGKLREEMEKLEAELSAALQRAEKAKAEVIWVFDIDGPSIFKQGNKKLHETMSVVTAKEVQHMADIIAKYRDAEKALPEESRMVGRVRMLEDKKQGEQACLDYIDKLRAHAAAVTAERDAVLEAL